MDWLTRVVLLFYPHEMRVRHGEGLADLYRDMYWRKGFAGRTVYFAKLLRDAIPQGLGARMDGVVGGRGPQGRRQRGSGVELLDQVWADLRFALRSLRRSPGFTFVTVTTLGVGIGANVAIFSLVNGVLLTSLPYPDSDRVVEFMYTGDRGVMVGASVPDVEDVRAQVDALEVIAQVQSTGATLLGDDPMRLEMVNVGPGFFEIFRIPAALGRTFTPQEYNEGEPPVAVLSDEFWRTTLGADPTILGRTLTLEGWDGSGDAPTVQPVVVGVMPAGFVDPYGPGNALWMTQPGRYGRGTRIFQAVGRVRDESTLDDARTEMAVVARNLSEAYPSTNANLGMTVASANERQIEATRRPLLVFMGAVGLLLLIACLNVASLILSRAQNRGGELAVRAALGAGKGRIASQLLVESLVLGVLGGILGVGLAVVGLDGLLAMVGDSLPAGRDFGIDGTVLGFAVLISVGTGLAFGVGPALRAGRHGAGGMGVKASDSRLRRSVRSGLVVLEMAAAVVLLAGATLLVRSFLNVFSEPPGFATENVLAFRLAPSMNRHPEREDITRLYSDLTDRIGEVPGVTAVASSSYLPVESGAWMNGFSFDDTPEENYSAHVRAVTPDYFDVLSIPVVLGRGFNADDTEGSTEVAVVNEAFVNRFVPDGNPIGKFVTMNRPSRVIVGVVADTRFEGLESPSQPEFYTPHAQQSQWWLRRFQWIVVHTAGDPASAFPRLRDIVRQVDPTIPISGVTTMRDVIGENLAEPRVRGVLVGVFALVALILAGVGIAGVMAYNVASRAREFGVRVALGARPGDLIQGVLWHGFRLTAAGGVIGLIGALAMGRFLASLLYEVSATDPVSLGSVVLVLTLASMIATYLPARRILGIDPVEALRTE